MNIWHSRGIRLEHEAGTLLVIVGIGQPKAELVPSESLLENVLVAAEKDRLSGRVEISRHSPQI